MFPLDTFWVSLTAVGKAGALASTGIYLHCRGFVTTSQAKEMLSRYSQQVGLPCLFFSKIVMSSHNTMSGAGGTTAPNTTTNLMVSQDKADDLHNPPQLAFILLALWPIYVVLCGLLVGRLTGRIAGLRCPTEIMTLVIATAFANSTGLPTTLLSLMTHALDDSGNASGGGGGGTDPTRYLTIYLVLYPVLQWGIGGTLLGVSESSSSSSSSPSSSSYLSARDPPRRTANEAALPPPRRILKKQNTKSSALDDGDTEEEDGTEATPDIEPLLLENGLELPETRENVSSASDPKPSIPTSSPPRSLSPPLCVRQSPFHFSWNNFCSTVKRALGQPPVRGAILGWIIVAIPYLHDLLNGGQLQWVGEAIQTAGQAAIPINMAVLGINLSKTFSNESQSTIHVDAKLIGSVVLGKLIIMPLLGLASVWMISTLVHLEPPVAAVLALVWATPTANTIMVMTDLSQTLDTKAKHGMARMLASQYVVAPVLLPLWVMLTLQLANTRQ